MSTQEHDRSQAFFPPLLAVLRSVTAMYRENRELRLKNAELEEWVARWQQLAETNARIIDTGKRLDEIDAEIDAEASIDAAIEAGK